MQKIGILVDTTCDLDLEIQHQDPNIKIVPLQIIFNDSRTFRDKYEISYNEMIAALDKFEAKTSLPTIQDTVNALDIFVEQGYTHIFTLALSDSLSGTHGMIKTVSEDYSDRLIIENIDTRSVSMGIGALVTDALQMINDGKSFEEISAFLNRKVRNRDVFFAVETLKYLIRGGRIGKLSGTVGEALDIKPIIMLDREGKLVSKDKVRGRKKSIARLVELVEEASAGKEIERVFVLHGAREEEALILKEKLVEKITAPIELNHLGALVSVHVGPGLVGAFVLYK
ncbi:MAG: DegV family protein [Peptostreptococcaceae bacterium]|nr:DegV family protein [Peptostreptococcaceae bacterium]